jgi:transcriptional regulator with XRE-family HTH domain
MTFAQERDLAERALADSSTRVSTPFPPTAKRIRAARERLGISQNELAQRWGEVTSMYWDLELRDDELFTCVNFGRLPALAAALGIPLMVLLFGQEPPEPPTRVTYGDVAERIRTRLSLERVTVDALSDVVGWELQPILDDPAVLATFNIAGVYDVCRAVGVDWVGLLT